MWQVEKILVFLISKSKKFYGFIKRIYRYVFHYSTTIFVYLTKPLKHRYKILKFFIIFQFFYHCFFPSGILCQFFSNYYQIHKTQKIITKLQSDNIKLTQTLLALQKNQADTIEELLFEYTGGLKENKNFYVYEE